MSSKILPLSESVRSQLRSGVSITSVGQCVEELVLNCLDAEATCIAVRIDLSIFRIQVVDNGHGISHENLKVLGSRHSTSKCHTLEDLTSNLSHYGFRGEALASIVDLAALIDVTTRSRSSTDTTYTKLFMYGNEKSISHAESQRPSIGTTITIQDFMYNMPVRRKLIKEAIDIENIRIRLESFALMHCHVSFSLRNDSNNDKIFQASKSNGLISTFIKLFGSERAQELAEVSHSVDHFSVSGYVSTQPHVTKSLQFVYVNKRVVLKTKIHKFLNELLSRSSIISKRLHPTAPAPGKTPSSPSKGLRLYGIFVINIECPLSEYDICLEPQKSVVEFKDWDKLLLCIEEMIVNFIQEEGLMISLDERFRRSGRELIEEESSVPHSSQTFLQEFSRKRTADTKVGDEPPKEKYGRTFCVEDNLSGLHSRPVRRSGNKKECQISCVEPSQDDIDDIAPITSDGDNENHYLVKCQHVGSINNISRQEPQKLEDCQISVITEKTDVKNLNVMVRGSVSSVRNDQELKNLSHVEYIKSIIAKQKRDQQELQKGSYKVIDDKVHSRGKTDKHSDVSDGEFIDEGHFNNFQNDDDVPAGSISLFEREKPLDNCLLSNKSLQSVEALSHLCYKTTETNKVALSEGSSKFESKFCETISEKSSLGELKELYEAEVKKMCVSDIFSTPEHVVRKTPSSPPALKNQLFSCNSRSNSIEQSTSSSALCIRVNENEKNSISSALKKGMLKHQKKITSCKYLQKFEFKKNVKNSNVKTVSGKMKTLSQQPRCLHMDCKSVSCKEENCLQPVKYHTKLHLLPKTLTSHEVEKETLPNQNSDSVTVCTFEKSSRNNDFILKLNESQIHEGKSKRETNTDLIRIPKVTGSRKAQNHFNLQTPEDNGTDLSTTVVSDVHKWHKGNFDQDMEGTGLDSFRFSPVLITNFNNDNHTETSESNQQLLETGNIPQHDKAEQSSCTVSVCKDVMEEVEKSAPVKSQWMPEHFKNFTTPDIHKKKMVCSSQNYVGQIFGNSVCSDPQVVGNQITTLKKHGSYESSVVSNFRKCQVTELLLCSGDVVKSKLVNETLLQSPHTQPFEVNKELSSDESKTMTYDHIATKVIIPESEIFIQKNLSISELGTPVLSCKDLVQKNVTKRTSDVCVQISSVLKDLDVITSNVDESETCRGIHETVESPKHSSIQNEMTESAVVTKERASVGFHNSSEYNLLSKLSENLWQQSNNACGKTTEKLFTERSGSNNSTIDGSGHHDATNFMHSSPHCKHTNTDSLIKYSSSVNANNDGMLPSQEVQSCVSPAPEDSTCMAIKTMCTDDIDRNKNVEIPTENEILHSPSLHFSQLTLPSIAKSSQTTEFSSTCEDLGITLPTVSDHSQCSIKHETSEDPKLIKSSCEEISVEDTDKDHVLAKQKELSHETGIDMASEDNGNTGEGDFSGFDSLIIEADRESLKEKNKDRAFSCESEDYLASLDISKVNFDEEDFPGSDSLITENEKKIDRKNNGLCISINNDAVGTFCEIGSSKTLGDNSDETHSIRNVNCTEKSKIVGGWQETTDCNGKKIYFNVRTGNTSYDKPIVTDIPVWNSSQSLGAPLLKVPLTAEPDYMPYGKFRLRKDFTLSHGYSTFISWKKRRESEKNACTKAALASGKTNNAEKSNTEITSNSSNLGSLISASENLNGSKSVERSGSVVECKEILSQDPVSLSVPPETLDSLLINFEADNESVKWLVKPSSEESSQSNLAEICQLLEPQNFAMDADVLHIEPCVTTGEGVSSKGGPVRIYNIVHPYKFTKNMLPSCKVLGQLDNKFIACKIKYTSQDETNSPLSLVVLFDQHAVHERVRLESIIEENLELAESGKQVIRSSMVTPPMSLTLPDDEVRLMAAYKELFFQRGLHFTKTSNSEVSFHAIPNCLVAREASVTRCRRSQTANIVVESIVHDMCHMLYTTGGVVGIIPKPLQYVMNNQACRGAVKFGDELTLTQCQEMIDSLVSCQLPFQCAHGRPSVVPVVNMTHLEKLEKKDGKPNIKKLVDNLSNQDGK